MPGPTPRRRLADRLDLLVLALVALVPQLLSQPGLVDADTKSYLYLDPGHFLAQSLSIWDPGTGLGTVTFQQVGYLWPMGPFYLVTHALGVPTWVAERLWVALILFGAGAGVRFLCRTLPLEGPGASVAALAFMLSPYTLQYLGRISVILLPWAGLPWMVALAARSARRGGWRDAALFGLVVVTVGGINATSLLYVGIAPALWLVVAAGLTREVTWRRAVGAAWRIALTTVVGSLWWIAGLYVDGAYGVNVLKYTETVLATSSTSSANEVLRGLGYWYFYGSDAYGPWVSTSVQFTQELWLVATSYALPALAIAGAAVVRWRHRAYFVLLVLVGTVLAVGAYPYTHPTLVGRGLRAFYTDTTAGFALRSTDRATPMVLLGLTMLLGAAVSAVVAWLAVRPARRGAGPTAVPGTGPRWRRTARRLQQLPWVPTLVVVLVVALVVAANPAIFNGTTVADHYLMPATPPASVRQAAAALNAEDPGTRVLAEPGEDFAQYDWGDTVDPVWPALLADSRPFVTREQLLLGSLPSADMLYALDNPVQNDVVQPSALAPLLRLMSVGDLVVQNDLGYARYQTPLPTTLWSEFSPTPPGLGAPTGYGPPTPDVSLIPEVDEAALAASPDAPVPSPIEVFPVDDPRPIDRAESSAEPVIVDGDASGIAEAAGAGLLAGSPAIVYAGTLDQHPALEHLELASHPTLVVTDSNKRRFFRWNSIEQDAGPTLTASQPQSGPSHPDDAPLNLFPGLPASAQTVAKNIGVRSVTASSYGDDVSYLPEDRPAHAIDGNLDTAWLTGGFFPPEGQWWQVVLDHPVTTDQISLTQPTFTGSDRYITEVTLRFTDGRHSTSVVAHLSASNPNGAAQIVHFSTRTFTTLRITIDATNLGTLHTDLGIGPVGFSEVGIDGVVDDEVLVMPSDLLRAAGAGSLADRLVLTMQRQRVEPIPPRRDPEMRIARQFTLPTARTFSLSGTATISTLIPDNEIDQLVGRNGPVNGILAFSSGRLPGDLNDGAQAAIDGNPATAWSPGFGANAQVGAWIQVDLPHAITFDHMNLQVVADGMHSVPTSLTIADVNAAGAPITERHVTLPTIADGRRQGDTVTVPLHFPALTGSRIRVTVDTVRFEYTRDYYSGAPIALPIGIAELGIPGVHGSATPPQLPGTCFSNLLTIDGRSYPVRIVGSTAAALDNEPVQVEPCGADDVHGITLGAGTHILQTALGHTPATGWNIDSLVLDSAPGGGPEPVTASGSVPPAPTAPAPTVRVAAQDATSARLTISGLSPDQAPFWLVLGQSIDAGWHADVVGGRSLGPPTLVDGFANGWLVHPAALSDAIHHGQVTVTLSFSPQGLVTAGLLATLAGSVLFLGVVLVPDEAWRRLRWRWLRHTAAGGGPPWVPDTTAPDRARPAGPTFLATDADARGPSVPTLAWQQHPEPQGGSWRRTLVTALAAGLVAAAVGGGTVGLVVGVVGLAAGFVPRARAALGWAATAAAVAMVADVVVHQATHPSPPGGGWVTQLGTASTLAWCAVCLLAADAAFEVVRRRRRRTAGDSRR
jgi:arabinofuranan 3-O-arabinosyltransferase